MQFQTLEVPRAPLLCTDLCHHNSAGDWARELFKQSKDVESLQFRLKKLKSFGFAFFVGDGIIGVDLAGFQW